MTWIDWPKLPLAKWVDQLIFTVVDRWEVFFDALKAPLAGLLEAIVEGLLAVPAELLLFAIALAAWRLAGRGVAFMAAAGLALMLSLGLWEETVTTLALVLVSTVIAVLLGVPLGILGAQSRRFQACLRPVLDFMQTMPSFVYLIPVLMLFGIGAVPAILATIIFAMPPAVRLTTLGIQQVPAEVIEAARAFGSTRGQMLFKVQLPVALPTIMAGVNQTIMLALSMAVIASMIGAGGLGGEVFFAISRVQPGRGFAGGVGIVILAVILDRISQSVGRESPKRG